MIPWEKLGEAKAPDGGTLTLHRRGTDFVIKVDGKDLMASRAHGSEEELARLACAGRAGPVRVLIGGLGLGYTVRAALDLLTAAATVVVAELVPAVIEWNRGPLAGLAGRPLDDPRVTVHKGDVGALLRTTTTRFDAILLDVDNGPIAMTRRANQALYGDTGLATAKRALRRGGAYAVWSASADEAFLNRLRRAGFDASAHTVRERGAAGGARHTIFLGRLPG